MRCSEPRARLRPTFRVFAAHPLCAWQVPAGSRSLILYLARPMKSLLQFVLVAVTAGAILIDAASLGRAQESSPSPPGTARSSRGAAAVGCPGPEATCSLCRATQIGKLDRRSEVYLGKLLSEDGHKRLQRDMPQLSCIIEMGLTHR